LMAEKPHSRLPVFRDTLDDIIGVVHMKDVVVCLSTDEDFELEKIMRKPLIIAPSMPVLDLLLEMRRTHIHMAMVVDEFGGIDGLITIENVIEGIVGEIQDEHETEEQTEITELPDGSVLVDARVTIEDFTDRFGAVFDIEEMEDIDTMGGIVFSIAGRVPSRGELLHHDSGLDLEIVEAGPRRVKRIRVRNLPGP
ncbi:MAG: transporter associated domain-containing protein, partial [Verrucomicrobiota bacterium]|nr:transporter associated domain-containing protein [Verrucomicrobiota bacterium]